MFAISLLLVLLAIALIYIFLNWNYDYWKKRGVNGPKPALVVGNYPNLFTQKVHMIYDLDEIYRKFKSSEDFVGIFSGKSPQLLVLSPEFVRRVLSTDFKYFHDNEASTMVDEKSDYIFANNPFALTGETWKDRRAEITPGLTLSRIKTNYGITTKICQKLTEYIKTQQKIAHNDGLDVKDIALRFTSEVVTDSVLGLDAKSFAEKPTPIVEMIKKLFNPSIGMFIYFMVIGLFPSLKSIYKGRFISKETENFLLSLMKSAIDMRLAKPQNERTDYLNYMLQLREKKQMSLRVLAAHTMTFLLDGYETTAGVIAHCLLLLARNTASQDCLREELTQHLNRDGEIDFDILNEMPYLDACVHETIRLFPPGFFSNRICTEPIELTSKKSGHSVHIAKGTTVVLPLYSIMTDEAYFPDAQQFQPERFLKDHGGSVKKYQDMGLYYGFGGGPRMCIGMRFALTQTKAAIVSVLSHYNVRVNPKTRKDNTFDPKNFLVSLDGGVWLDFEALG